MLGEAIGPGVVAGFGLVIVSLVLVLDLAPKLALPARGLLRRGVGALRSASAG